MCGSGKKYKQCCDK
ncbi:MAG: SEC-C domain-containing protein [Bacilli bacterium]|nr:SEC-C domain-containing protein [Bacilli bacterium]